MPTRRRRTLRERIIAARILQRRFVLLILPGLLFLTAPAARGQLAPETADRLPQVIPAPVPATDHILEVGASLGRYDFDGSDVTSGFDGQFLRYTRSRPARDSWRIDLGRQGRFGESSLDVGLGYTRLVRETSFSAGISGGTSDVLSNEYRLDLGVSRPVAGFVTSLGYTRLQSRGENSSHGFSASLVRWLPRVILGAGYRIDFGRPGDTESSALNFGVTYYSWRKTYLGAGVSFGEVSYQLIGPGVPVSAGALVDYESWSAHLALTRYLDERSGFNLRYDHSRAKDIWSIDGVTAGYFREW